MVDDSTGSILASSAQQATMHHALRVPYIPTEVHRIIAQHVDQPDLPNYRLVNKTFAKLGAEELFQTILFHCSSASLSRIGAIKKAEHLNKYCCTLVWDTNYWNIPDVRDLHEWKRYFTAKACLPKHQPIAVGEKLSPEKLIDLANNRFEWERYLNNIHDEKVVKSWFNLKCALRDLSSLHKLYVCNGYLERTHRGYKKTNDFVFLPESPIHYRGERLYNDGGPVRPLQRPGAHAFDALGRFHDIGWQLTKLRLDAVCWSVFSSEIGRVASLQQLLSFHLRITIRFEHHWGDTQYRENQVEIRARLDRARNAFRQHYLMDFLVGLPKLQSLKLELGECSPSPSTVGDIFSEYHTWPDLRKITLGCFDTAPEALLSLLERHRSTLKALWLHDIWFDTPVCQPDPPEILAIIHKILRLRRVKLSGDFGHTDQVWDLDYKSLARAVAEYLVHGGTCPLNATNSKKMCQID